MQRLEQAARTICALDLASAGVSESDIPPMVDRFWPVIANETRDSVTVIGQWPFTVEEIARLTEEFRTIVRHPVDDGHGNLPPPPAGSADRHSS